MILGNSDIAALTSEYSGKHYAMQQQQRRQAKGTQREMSFYEAANTVYQQQQQLANPGLSYEEVLNEDFQFDIDAHDVMVFLHIQKTGGTSFGRHLVQDLDLKVRRVVDGILFYSHWRRDSIKLRINGLQ